MLPQDHRVSTTYVVAKPVLGGALPTSTDGLIARSGQGLDSLRNLQMAPHRQRCAGKTLPFWNYYSGPTTCRAEFAQVDARDGFDNKAAQIVLRHPIAHVGRQPKRLVTVGVDKSGHGQRFKLISTPKSDRLLTQHIEGSRRICVR